ncbi:MAG: hypothetical protein BWX60_00793 [Candidatus Marinimicrobia bacterium ADurb.Bin030]|nr:MAG: hypothetical protein BWX60_00793 [Candidatus Marinimicrobia bacterium ADurb.Bin030]
MARESIAIRPAQLWKEPLSIIIKPTNPVELAAVSAVSIILTRSCVMLLLPKTPPNRMVTILPVSMPQRLRSSTRLSGVNIYPIQFILKELGVSPRLIRILKMVPEKVTLAKDVLLQTHFLKITITMILILITIPQLLMLAILTSMVMAPPGRTM